MGEAEWITMRGAMRLANCAAAVIYAAAVRGEIEADVVTGCPPRYRLADVRRLAEKLAETRKARCLEPAGA